MRYCPKCGFLIKNGANICHRCQTKLIYEEIEQLDFPNNNKSEENSNSKKEVSLKLFILIFLSIFLSLFTILLFIFLLKRLS